jgi:hypothetical protein
MTLMPIDRLFLAFMTLCGLALASLLIFFPNSAQFGIPPYFWVLIPMAIFETIAFARGRGVPGSVIAIWTRLIGFVIATALMMLVPYLAGQPVVQIF